MKRLLSISAALLMLAGSASIRNYHGISEVEAGSGPDGKFTFAFLADIHLQPELEAGEGFRRVIDLVNELEPDFVITGGDLIMDALKADYGRADSLYRMYERLSGYFKMPVYNTIGNHDILGWCGGRGISPSDSLFGKGMYEQRLGKTFYSFDHKGWHFIILDSVERGTEGGYTGRAGEEQLEWIGQDLSMLDSETPVAVSTHIPLVSVIPQLREGPGEGISSSEVVANSREVLELFRGYDLRLVLQGHLHLIEEIEVEGTTYITAGAVSGRWWRGPRRGVEEGFALIRVDGREFDWEYIDSGWEAAEGR
ncbi:MAG: metallophosphoesterase family protein [Candidatus Krumholzibacteriota bacterium]